MAIIGYARVSSIGQKLDVQLEKLQSQGCEKIYQEKESAGTTKRPQLTACLDYVREGDILVITKLDRLARSTLDLCNIAKRLADKEVTLQVIDQNIDTSNSTGRLMFNMLATIAQFENEIRAERQMDGIKKAQANGVVFGRVKVLTPKQITELKNKRQSGILIKDLMAEYKLSKKSIYNYLGLYKQDCSMAA
jgi:DNA invertase Pin-like site-specific DNA recombinase